MSALSTSPTIDDPKEGLTKRSLAWAMYDWANSAVVTLVIAAVFPVYYNQVVAGDLPNAASIFAYTGAIALLLSIMTTPVIGTLADITGRRKRFLIISTTAGTLAVCAMLTTRAGGWQWASALFILTQLLLNVSLTLYDSLLSHVTTLHNQNRLSALGYALGYIGGGIHLALCFLIISNPQWIGLSPDGAGKEAATRIALMTAGIWWLLFAIPLFITVPEPPAAPKEEGQTGRALKDAFTRLGHTLRDIRNYRQLFLMLIAFWLYTDGIGTIIGLSTTYGSETLRMSSTLLLGALLLTQFVAFPYALMFGRIPNKESKYRDFFVAFIVWTAVTFPIMGAILARNEYPEVARQLASLPNDGYVDISPASTLLIVVINQVFGLAFSWFVGRYLLRGLTNLLNTKYAVLLGIAVYTLITIWAFFIYTPSEFWLLAWLVGTVQGGTQALSRSLYSTMTPSHKSGEFFGFYALTDKFGSVFGFFLFGVISQLTNGNLRVSILTIIIFFIIGGILLSRVDVEEGRRVARQEDSDYRRQEMQSQSAQS